MPSWSIHLKIDKEINKRLNIDNDLFTFGSLIADVDRDWKIGRHEAHYYGRLKFPKCPHASMIDINGFLDDYRDKLTNPLILGYYTHLLADSYFNEYVYYNKWVQDKDGMIIGARSKDGTVIDINNDHKVAQSYKHRDLELYGKRLFNTENLYLPKYSDKYASSISLLKDSFVTNDNVIRRINYLNTGFKEFNQIKEEEKDKEYVLFYSSELDELVDGCILYINNELDKISDIKVKL